MISLRSPAIALLLLLSACSLFGKKKPDGGTPPEVTDGPYGYRLNAEHTGAMDGTLTAPLRRRWIAKTTGTPSYPIVTETGVFIIESGTRIQLRAYDVENGNVLWPTIDLSADDATTRAGWLAYQNGVLFALTDKGVLTAVRASTGATLWSTPLRERTPAVQFSWPPTAAGTMIYVPGSGVVGNVSAVSQSDGTVMWTTTQSDSDAPPAIGSNLILSTFGCSNVAAFDLPTGILVWKKSSGCSQEGFPFAAVADDIIYAGTGASNQSTGLRLDKKGETSGSFISRAPPAIHEGHVVTLLPTQGHTFKSVDPTEANVSWTDTDADDVLSPPIIVNGLVFSAASDGTVRAVDEYSGTEVWVDNVGASIQQGKGASVWNDLGSNGEVLVVSSTTGVTVYESDPAPPTPDDSYRTYCDDMNVAFHIEGDGAHKTSGGTSLRDGSKLIEGPETLEAADSVKAAWTTLNTPADYQTITISTQPTNMPRWTLEFATRDQLKPLSEKSFDRADTRSSYDDQSLGLAKLKITRVDNNVTCNDGNARFEFTSMHSNGSGLLSLNGYFEYHCNRESAAVRGCFRYQP